MNIDILIQTVLKNSEDMTRSSEQVKNAILQSVETGKAVVAALEKTADTNAKQTEAINRFISDKATLEKDKENLDLKHEKRFEEFRAQVEKERGKLMKIIVVLLVALFIGVGGFSIVSKLHSLGLISGL